MADNSEPVTQHCDCGAELYRVKWTGDAETRWAECARCGRPTRTLGDGAEKQREWEAEREDRRGRASPSAPHNALDGLGKLIEWLGYGTFLSLFVSTYLFYAFQNDTQTTVSVTEQLWLSSAPTILTLSMLLIAVLMYFLTSLSVTASAPGGAVDE